VGARWATQARPGSDQVAQAAALKTRLPHPRREGQHKQAGRFPPNLSPGRRRLHTQHFPGPRSRGCSWGLLGPFLCPFLALAYPGLLGSLLRALQLRSPKGISGAASCRLAGFRVRTYPGASSPSAPMACYQQSQARAKKRPSPASAGVPTLALRFRSPFGL